MALPLHQLLSDAAIHSNNAIMKSPAATPTSSDVPPGNSSDIPWRGGEHYFEGMHDRFCFSCGAHDNIIECQTCSRCYHPQCMFPPLDSSQLPDIWFCPVCVGRNWHMPLDALQTPPTTLPGTFVEPHPPPSITLPNTSMTPTSLPTGENQHAKHGEVGPRGSTNPQVSNRNLDPQRSDDLEGHNQRWKEAQRWRENSWYAPRGYVLDPSSGERFISLHGEEPISLSSVMKNRSGLSDNDHDKSKTDNHDNARPPIPSPVLETAHGKTRRGGTRTQRSPARKRSKYSDLPKDLEKALELITSNLEGASRSKKSQDDVDSKARIMEQKLRIQDGEVLIIRQELQAVRQKLLDEVSSADILRAENAKLCEKLQETRELVEQKENDLKNWQGMLRTMIGNVDGRATS